MLVTVTGAMSQLCSYKYFINDVSHPVKLRPLQMYLLENIIFSVIRLPGTYMNLNTNAMNFYFTKSSFT